MENFDIELSRRVLRAEEIIFSYIPEAGEFDDRIAEAMEYSLKAGGKRLRPVIMREVYGMFSEGEEESELLRAFMAAIEFIHTYSLCHDDLPAMDNDDTRRGKPSVWAKFGEAQGVLAGDALLNGAFEIIAGALAKTDDDEEIRRGIKAFGMLARKAGIFGMVGGQSLDVLSEKNSAPPADLRAVEYIYKNKTSALLEAAFCCGALLSGADEASVSALCKAAGYVGMAFQIRDDILDLTSNEEELGKPVGSDVKNNKVTYVTLKGLEKSQEDVDMYSLKAEKILSGLPGRSEMLLEIVRRMSKRSK